MTNKNNKNYIQNPNKIIQINNKKINRNLCNKLVNFRKKWKILSLKIKIYYKVKKNNIKITIYKKKIKLYIKISVRFIK